MWASFLEACASYSSIDIVLATIVLPEGAGTLRGPRLSFNAEGGLTTRLSPFFGV